jgi:hypothetical protein
MGCNRLLDLSVSSQGKWPATSQPTDSRRSSWPP